MDYTLAVLTHGRGETLDQALASFFDKVKPSPSRVIVHCDAPTPPPHASLRNGWSIRFGGQEGFCKATGALWRGVSLPETEPLPEFTFWLEHDFVFLRPVDLQPLAYVLDGDTSLCQMQLMRTPVSREEISAGGLFQSRPGEYEQRYWFPTILDTPKVPDGLPYLHHRSYFTTNPSLMRTAWMTANQWPDDGEPQCEGRFGIDLVRRGFSYGVWGAGEPWVEHIGVRTGFGY